MASCVDGFTGTPVTYICGALGEWETEGDALVCDDIDECAAGTDECEDTCKNTVGGYECECPKSRLRDDSRTCEPRK